MRGSGGMSAASGITREKSREEGQGEPVQKTHCSFTNRQKKKNMHLKDNKII